MPGIVGTARQVDRGLINDFGHVMQSGLDKSIVISLPSPAHLDNAFGEQCTGRGRVRLVGERAAGPLYHLPRGLKRLA